jgi:hypothetical protein
MATRLPRVAPRTADSFTRYADELTFSGSSIYDNHVNSIESILNRHGWTINERKTRCMRMGDRKVDGWLNYVRPVEPNSAVSWHL